MATMHRARAVMKIDRKNTKSVTDKATAMSNGIGGDPQRFANPNPPVSAYQNQIVVVNKAEAVAQTRAKGSAKARNVERIALVALMENGTCYVQNLADSAGSLEEAEATIQAAGLSVALVGDRAKPILGVTQGPQPGDVLLEANAKLLGAAGRRKTFLNWQYTLDGKTFVTLQPTPKASTSVTGLTPLTTYGFRVSVTSSDGIQGPWSQIVNFLVH